MQEKTFKYDRCDKNENITTAVYFKYSGGIQFEIIRDDKFIEVNLSGSSELILEAIKDLMANICYVADL